MVFASQVLNLTPDFYKAYPFSKYPEILRKKNRPYSCLIVEYHDDVFLCLPYRSNIGHKNSYRFQNSQRSLLNKSGIDYSKMVVVKKINYLSSVDAIVDQDEYNETMQNISAIVDDAVDYLEKYIDHVNGVRVMHPRQFSRKYSTSTLPYFHAELNLPTSTSASQTAS